ncbi:MAG: PilN domain-containing protein [Acidiferrobacteraceae bacterium]
MRQQINLYHPVFRKQQKRFSAVAMAQAALLVAVGAALLYSYTAWQVHALSDAVLVARVQRLSAAKQLAQAQAQFGNRGFARRVRRIRREIKARTRVETLLAHGRFGNTTGYSAYFEALARGDIPGLWITSFSARGAGTHIEIKGKAMAPDLVPRFVANLGRSTPFAGVDFGQFQIEQSPAPARYIRFVVGRDATAGGAQ